MSTPHAPREITDLEAAKALAHPRRQRIIQHLSVRGPATSAELARALGLNTGATSYHLRELARHGFIEEVPERAHGRERWWRSTRGDLRYPPRSRQSPELRSAFDEMNRLAFARDLEMFGRFQAERDEMGEWADGLIFSRGTIQVSLAQFSEFFEDYIALLKRYKPTDQDEAEVAGEETRVVLTRFLAFPAPDEPPEDAEEMKSDPP